MDSMFVLSRYEDMYPSLDFWNRPGFGIAELFVEQ